MTKTNYDNGNNSNNNNVWNFCSACSSDALCGCRTYSLLPLDHAFTSPNIPIYPGY